MPVNGVTNAAQPVMGYNYGAQQPARVRTAIKFTSTVCIAYTTVVWLILMAAPQFFSHIVHSQTELLTAGVPSMNVYFFGFFMMSLQFSGQSVFVALGKSKHAVFFSLLRKVFIVVPLTLLLPHLFGLGTTGVFLAEPISNFIGGAACFFTMLKVVGHLLREQEQSLASAAPAQK